MRAGSLKTRLDHLERKMVPPAPVRGFLLIDPSPEDVAAFKVANDVKDRDVLVIISYG